MTTEPTTTDLTLLSTPEEGPSFAERWERGRWDVGYFAEHLLGIRGHPGQQEMWRTGLMRGPEGWRAAYLTLCISAGNRAGKTLGLAIYIAHSTLYKMGTRPPEPGNRHQLLTWMKRPYDWWHFGLQGEVSELVHIELVHIFNGVHVAQQGRGCPMVDMLGPAVANLTTKERGDYPWIQFHPALGGGQIHFRSTAEKALGALGKEMNGVSWDECAFSPDFEFVVDEVLNLRRLGSGGQMFLISTSTEGITAFTDKWNEGDPEAPDRRAGAMSLRMSTRLNVGYGLDQTTFDRLIESMPEYLIPQNIDGFAIESRKAFFGAQAVDAAFVADLPPENVALPRHRYVQGVDPALTYDSTYAIHLDHTDPTKVVGVRIRRKTGRQTVLSVSSLVIEGHRAFNTPNSACTTAIDSTGFGGATFRDALRGLHPLRSVEFGGTRSKKLKLLLDLKAAIEKGILKFPREGAWLTLRRQMLGYRLEDRKLETDALMAVAVAWSEAKRNRADSSQEGDFRFFAPTQGGQDRVLSRYGNRRVSVAQLMTEE